MRHISLKRQQQMRHYLKLRKKYFDAYPWCQFPGCDRPSAVIHHRRGRFGARLNDVTWWAASCVEHNDFAETHTGEALRLGWLVRIEDVNPEWEMS